MKTRPYTFNAGTNINGTKQVGYIAAVTGTTINSSPDTWYMGPDEDTGYVIVSPYPTKIAKNIVSDGLILHLDAGNKNSYIGTGNVWSDISGSNAHATLLNSPTWNSSGYFTFDGINQGADGVNVPQNYVDLMIGLYHIPNAGLDMVFCKYNDLDKSFRISGSNFRYSANDANDWNYLNESYNFADGNLLTSDFNVSNQFHIVRLVNQNSTFTPPFVYSISSDFLSRRFKGNIAFVLCYNRILNINEVKQNFNAYRGRFGL
jgi:hypothetical protein